MGRPLWQVSALWRWMRPRSLAPAVDLCLALLGSAVAQWALMRVHAGQAIPFTPWLLIGEVGSWSWWLAIVWVVLIASHGAYGAWPRGTRRFTDEVGALVGAALAMVIVYMALYFLTVPRTTLPRRLVLYTTAFALVSGGIWRFALAAWQGRQPWEDLAMRARRFLGGGTNGLGDATPVNITADLADEEGVELLTVRQVARLLQVHEATVWRWCKNGTVKAFRAGQQWRIPSRAVTELAGRSAGAVGEASDGGRPR